MLIILTAQINAQTATGEADIRVLDASGAVVPHAQVELLGSNSGNLVRTLTTNGSGVANATFLQPGVYDFSVSATGFDKLVQKGVAVRIGETVNLTLTLQTGKNTESVTVVGQSPLVEQKSSTLAQVNRATRNSWIAAERPQLSSACKSHRRSDPFGRKPR